MFGCKKENDTVWIESRDYAFSNTGNPEWWQGDTNVEAKLHMTRFFQAQGVEIFSIETHLERAERLNWLIFSVGIIYCEIHRNDLPIMQEYEFKLISD